MKQDMVWSVAAAVAGLMACAVRAVRTLIGSRGERPWAMGQLATRGPGTEAQATGDVAGGAWWVAGEEQTASRPADRPQRARPLSRGPPGTAWRVEGGGIRQPAHGGRTAASQNPPYPPFARWGGGRQDGGPSRKAIRGLSTE